MAYEIVQISSWTTSGGTLSNPTYAYDNGVGGGPVTGSGYSSPFSYSTNDTYYASQTSTVNSTLYTLTSSGMSARTQTWTSSNLVITYELITAGDGGSTQNDSTATIAYTTDGTNYTSITSISQDWDTGRVTYTGALGANPTLANIKVKMTLQGASSSGKLPNIISGSAAQGYLWHAYVEGTYYSAPTLANNGPVLLGNNVTITPTFDAGIGVSVAPGSWGAWTSGVGQAVALPYNKLYVLTQSGIGTAGTVPQAKLPTTPAASMSMSQMRQVVTGGGTDANFSINHSYVRVLSGTANNAQVSFSQLSNTSLSTGYYW